MNRVKSFAVEGFRSLKSVELNELGQVTVLIGPNGAGKSNLLSAMRLVAMISSGSLGLYIGRKGGASSNLHYGPKISKEINLRVELDDVAPMTYQARLGHAALDRLLFLEESCWHGDQHFGSEPGQFESSLGTSTNALARAMKQRLQRWSYFHFHDTSDSSPLRNSSNLADASYLKSDGKNLASYLWALRNGGDETAPAWNRILGWVQIVAPFIKDLVPEAPLPGATSMLLTWRDERDEIFGPEHLSDGTLRAIALFTALGQPSSRLPDFITIDEPELGLHPAALSLFAQIVQSVAGSCQIVLGTQSPLFSISSRLARSWSPSA